MQEVRRFPCVPCFIFPKTSWNVSNRSFPVLTVLSVWMTGASSATSSTSSSTDFSGRMFLMSTARTDPCTTVLSGGVSAEFSKKNFNKLSNQTPFDGSLMLDSPTLRLTARRQVYSKRGFSTSHLPNKRRPKFQTSCRLWRAWAARPVFAGWRTVQRLQRCSHSPAPSSRYLYVAGRRRLWRELAVGISES